MNPVVTPSINAEPQRRLSPWRVALAVVILSGLTATSLFSWQWWGANKTAAAYKPWFASYVDVTATPTYAFEKLGTTSTRNVILSFVVASSTDSCTPTWGGYYSLDEAAANLDLDRRIARLQQQKGAIAVSFGGLKNEELAVSCQDEQALTKAYASVIDRYDVSTIDLDLEKNGLSDTAAAKRRATAIAKLQSDTRQSGRSLAVWVTLPVTSGGLSDEGIAAVRTLLASGVDIAGVNAMTMNFGDSKKDSDMSEASTKALENLYRQLNLLYQQQDIYLSPANIWKKIGTTPMIGQNDIAEEVFTIDNAKTLNQFASTKGVGRMSMWSANRDLPCGENYVNTQLVSDSCSGVAETKLAFTEALSRNFVGEMRANAGIVTTKDPQPVQTPDDPATSPYQIWSEEGAYLQGTKVVWRHNVYEAKWWTQGDLPDNPVLQEYQTPWQLVGPVLAGEKPVPQPTLPAGTYPEWSGDSIYESGQRVLFNGVPYQSKWWNNGQSPAAASSNPTGSPWVPLTQNQIKEALGQ